MTQPRFRHLSVVWELQHDWCDKDHIRDALEAVEAELVRLGLAQRFIFVVTTYGDRLAIRHPDRVIVVQTQDEGHELPAYAGDVFMVFRPYRPFGALPDNLRVIPLGCNKDVPALAPKPMQARSIDTFFIGRVEFREDFLAAALPLNGRPDIAARIAVGPEFRKGMAPEGYAATLVDTKVALSPRGVSHETFRTYEALRAGCAVIAQRQLPAWFTEGWPVIEVDEWSGLEALLKRLLADPAHLDELSARGLAWWRERCSPAATGRYMAGEIVRRLTRG